MDSHVHTTEYAGTEHWSIPDDWHIEAGVN